MSTSSQDFSVLTGKIVHCLELTSASSDWSGSRKRRRDENIRKGPRSSTSDVKPCEDGSSSARAAGFFFLPADKHQANEYLLIVPQCLLKTVCDATRYHSKVQITDYDRKEFSDSPRSVSLLYIHPGGLSVATNTDEQSDARSPTFRASMFSLSYLKQAELSKANDRCRIRKSRGPTEKGKECYTFHATVDAISPIIAAVPSDPFALLELYEPGDTAAPNSCVVVLKGANALMCHAGIQPGDHITFRNVRRQRWHVPSSFSKKGLAYMEQRTPNHVFVVSDCRCIDWEVDDSEKMPPLPSTVVPLSSIQGLVRSIHTKPLGPNGASVIHAVEVVLSKVNQSGSTCLLYTTHFPMSPNLTFGLTKGAVVRAVNIHALSFTSVALHGAAFGACLRSSITVVSTHMNSDVQISCQLSAPFAFSKARQSYERYELQSCLATCRVASKDMALGDMVGVKVPSDNELEEMIWKLVSSQERIDDQLPRSSTLTASKRKSKRDPYLEFFDHPCAIDWERLEDDVGCDMSKHSGKTMRFTVASLSELRHASYLAMHRELVGSSTAETGSRFFSSDYQAGWTASIQLSPGELLKAVRDAMEGDFDAGLFRLFTVGAVTSVDKNFSPSMLSDASSCLPLSIVSNSVADSFDFIIKSDVVVVDIDSSIISCLCVGKTSGTLNEDGSVAGSLEPHLVQLPSLLSHIDERSQSGSCSLLACGGFLFVLSVHLVYATGHVMKDAGDSPTKIREIIHSGVAPQMSSKLQDVYSCLGRETQLAREDAFVGLLTRQRYRFKKLRNGSFLGCTLTLSHFPIPPGACSLQNIRCSIDTAELSSLQSIELKLEVDVEKKRLEVMRKSLLEVLGGSTGYTALDEQVNLATAWWEIADSSVTSLIVSTGYDDVRHNAEGAESYYYVPVLSVPASAIEHGNFGYIRFRCGVDKLSSRLVQVTETRNPMGSSKVASSPADGASATRFVSVGGRKVLPGALDHNTSRKIFSSYKVKSHVVGELRSIPPFASSGVPSLTLANLHWRICSDVRNRTQTALAPSMVQCIRHARLLSISFCRAHVQCSRCFEPLVHRRQSNDHVGIAIRKKTSSASSMYEDTGPSFWHLPLPIPGLEASSTASFDPRNKAVQYGPALRPSSASRVLICPNDCPLDCAEVKWECSGVLDDGTGQARVYAEREVALALLGPSLNATAIAEGAWLVGNDEGSERGGIVFQKSIPPKQSLRYAVLEAQASVAGRRRRYRHRYHPSSDDGNENGSESREHEDVVWNLLSVEDRAEYAMQHHCRHSSEPGRLLDFVVRCKPLSMPSTTTTAVGSSSGSSNAFHLNRTQLEMAMPATKPYLAAETMKVPTYTLPPLKLNLVDCSSSVATNEELTNDLIRALR